MNDLALNILLVVGGVIIFVGFVFLAAYAIDRIIDTDTD